MNAFIMTINKVILQVTYTKKEDYLVRVVGQSKVFDPKRHLPLCVQRRIEVAIGKRINKKRLQEKQELEEGCFQS